MNPFNKANDYLQKLRYKRFVKTKAIDEVDRIKTHLTHHERVKLYQLAKSKSGKFVEIGSYLGASSFFIALAASEIEEPTKLYCVDTWQNDSMTEGKWDTYTEFQNNINKFENYIVALRGTSATVGKTFNDEIDFLFIDGDHSYTGVKQDFETWFPKLKKDGIIVFHDIGWAEGVAKLIREDVRSAVYNEQSLPNLYWAWKK